MAVKVRITSAMTAVMVVILFLLMHSLAAVLVPSSWDAAIRTIAANTAAVGACLLMARLIGMRPFQSSAADKTAPLWVAALAGAGFSCVVLWLMTQLPIPDVWMDSYTTQAENPAEKSWVALVSSLVIAPLAEEMVFRGCMYRALQRAVGTVPAALTVSLVFGLLHGTWLWGIYTALLSLLTIWVMERCGTLWAAVLCHAAFNWIGQLPAFLSDWPTWASLLYDFAGVVLFLFAVSRLLPTGTNRRTP